MKFNSQDKDMIHLEEEKIIIGDKISLIPPQRPDAHIRANRDVICVKLLFFLIFVSTLLGLHFFFLTYRNILETATDSEAEIIYVQVTSFDRSESSDVTLDNVLSSLPEKLIEWNELLPPPEPPSPPPHPPPPPPPPPPPHPAPQCVKVQDEEKFDCNPDEPINEQVCLSRGCCWKPKNNSISSLRGLPPINVPYCYYPKDFTGYQLVEKKQEPNVVSLRLHRTQPSGFPLDVHDVQVYISGLDDQRLRVRIFDPSNARWEVKLPFFNISQKGEIKSPLYSIDLGNEGNLKISRKSTGVVLFETDLRRLVFADQFIQLSVNVPSRYLYGIGEHKDSLRKELNWKRYTLFARDSPPIPDTNLYGSFPYYLMVEDSDKNMNAHGVFLLNSNAMDVILQPTPAVTWRTSGGILDFFIFMGPSAPEVTRQNLNLIGKPVMQPYWSLGFHLCKYGYNSLAKTNQTMQRNLDAGIPLDAQWNDIDYMDRHNDFTYDKVNFKELPEFVDELHRRGMHYVPMIDSAVSAGEKPGTYPPFDEGVRDGIFVKNSSGQIFIGKVWNPVSSAWPDYTSEQTWHYWTRQFGYFHKVIKFDGAWIDMDEPSNFYDGQKDGCPPVAMEKPPYEPGGTKLSTKTVCMTAQHKLGTHYNVHNLFGTYETFATYLALGKVRGKRPLIVSRSSFPGQGHFGSHWSGDIYSDWGSLKYSISNMLEFNLYGIPMIGSDICGFNQNTTVELCMRWSALGAFYPFARNHNSDDTIEQDPVALGPRVVAAAKYALNLRYTLIPYLYLLMFRSHYLGETVARPLFFEFPEDQRTYPIETEFMWGSSLLIVPILDPGTQSVNAYFPKALWYDYATTHLAIDSKGEYKNIHIDDDKIGVFMKGGTIIPTGVQAMNTEEQRKSPLKLIIAPDENMFAKGEYYIDDGESLDNIPKGNYTWSSCIFAQGRLKCTPIKCSQSSHFSSVTIMNREPVSKLWMNGQQITSFSYNPDKKLLNFGIPVGFNHCDGLEVSII